VRVRFSNTLILILKAWEIELLGKNSDWVKLLEIVRECWRIIPIVFVEVNMVIEVMVVSDWQLYVVTVIEFFK